LIESGATPNRNALAAALSTKNPECVNRLLDAGAIPDKDSLSRAKGIHSDEGEKLVARIEGLLAKIKQEE